MVEEGSLRAVVDALIDRLPIDGVAMPSELLDLARRRRLLPVTWDTGGAYLLAPDGQISEIGWEHLDWTPGENKDSVARNRVLFQGARKFPELAPFVPARPADARICPHCGGSGLPTGVPSPVREGLICFCGGLGWLPAGGEGGRQAGEGEPWISAEVLPHRPAVMAVPASATAIEDPEELATEAEQALAEQPARERRRRLVFDGRFFSLIPLGGIAVVVGLIDQVRKGKGGDLHRTGWGWKTSAIAVLVFGAAMIAAGIVGGCFLWRQRRQERDLERRYGKRQRST